VNELHTNARGATNRPHLTQGPERSGIDSHNDFSSRTKINRQNGLNAASSEAQVAYPYRKKDAIGWEATDLRVTAARKSRATTAIVVCAVLVCVGPLRHVYKIVCRARILEKGVKVTQDWKPK